MNKWLRDAAQVAGPGVLRMLASSWRFREVDPATGAVGPPIRRATNEIYALWHQQLLMLMLRHRDEDIAVMISRSSDGDLATPVVEGLGFKVVRGSSSRGGSQGLAGMVAASAAGHSLSLTVDGPRGPARVCKPGAVLIASRAGIPVVPTVAIPVGGRAVNSWDRFLIPFPGTVVYVAYGQPIGIPPDLSPQQVETWQGRVGSELENLVDRCELAAGRSWPRTRAA